MADTSILGILGGPQAVHKFGGTSVQSADAMRQVREIIVGIAREQEEGVPLAIVVSAMGGKPKVTDLLIDMVSAAAAGELDATAAIIERVRAKHMHAIAELFAEPAHAAEREALERDLLHDLADIQHLLRAVGLMRAKDPRLVGVISGYGEQWSARMMAALMRATRTPPGGANWVYLDARSVLVVDDSIATGVVILWDLSAAKLEAFVKAHQGASLLITGFIASTRDGGITTLGRDGSDYSASVFARLFEARAVTIWTDVSGVLSADPRLVADAYVLPEVSYNEAAELAHFGAKVVHPKTMQPALARLDWRPDARSIPIFVRNTFRPADRGTRIFETSALTTSREVCGVSAMQGMCLVNVMGRGMVGIPGVASRLFSALHELGVNVTAIAQASSEQSISVALMDSDGERAQAAVALAFRPELQAGHIEAVQLQRDVAILAVVGDGMSRRPGVAGKVMSALGQAGVSIVAIAQGCNETNITTVIEGRSSLRALRAVHAAFLAEATLGVALVAHAGPPAAEALAAFGGCVGSAQARLGLKVRCQQALLLPLPLPPGPGQPAAAPALGSLVLAQHEEALDLLALAHDAQQQQTQQQQQAATGAGAGAAALGASGGSGTAQALLAELGAALGRSGQPVRLLLDCSESPEAAGCHELWLRQGVHVLSRNPHALAGDAAAFARLSAARQSSGARYLCGSAYGDWLPVAATVSALLASGDSPVRVEACLSPGLSHALAAMGAQPQGLPARPFSELVLEAEAEGLFGEGGAEQQLSGSHARLRLLCLARELGLRLELADVELLPPLPLLPPPCAGAPELPLLQRLRQQDAAVAAAVSAAAASGCVLRLLCRLECPEGGVPRASVGLEALPPAHPFASLGGAALAFRFHTREHAGQPLCLSGAVSRGSGLGALWSELVRLARSLDPRARDRALWPPGPPLPAAAAPEPQAEAEAPALLG